MLTEDFFKQQLTKIPGLNQQDKILLAVSGGKDSMLLLHLFQYYSGMSFSVAHCNFQLRGKESDADETFVKSYCSQNRLTIHTKRFDTLSRSKVLGKGIQETARILRYEWFEELCHEQGYAYTATAHHAQDNMETILMNIIRGTGIKGLGGIAVKRDRIIRPLLAFDQRRLQSYLDARQIPYREDASNKEEHYTRNFIRHRIVPLMEELNPEVAEHFQQLAASAQVAEWCIETQLKSFLESFCSKKGKQLHIPFSALHLTPSPFYVLLRLLQPYGFNANQVQQMLDQDKGSSGKKFISVDHQIITNRDEFILCKTIDAKVCFTVESIPCTLDYHDQRISFSYSQTFEQETDLPLPVKVLQLDSSEINQADLLIRSWEKADKFRPLGMKGFKKLSDFFIDNKVPISAKEKALILCQGEQILAVLPYQIDDRFKVTDKTNKILRIECT